jgi:hypothetical protein
MTDYEFGSKEHREQCAHLTDEEYNECWMLHDMDEDDRAAGITPLIDQMLMKIGRDPKDITKPWPRR